MVEPFSIATGVITVLDATKKSIETLYHIAKGIRDAPETLKTLNKDLAETNRVIVSVERSVKKENLSKEANECLEQTMPLLKDCQKACDDFQAKLKKATSHSEEDDMSFRDKFRVHRLEKDASFLHAQLGRYQQTWTVTVGIANFEATQANHGALVRLENLCQQEFNSLTGELRGLALATSALAQSTMQRRDLDTALAGHTERVAAEVTTVLDDYSRAIARCVGVYTAGLRETTKDTGNYFKLAQAEDEAKLLMGIIGNISLKHVSGDSPINVVDQLLAKGKSKVMGGALSGDVALEFMK